MKKILVLLLAVLLCFSLCACGGENKTENNKTQQVNESELLGEWYEVKSADRLVLNSDGSLDYYKNNSFAQPGHWELNGGVINANNTYIYNGLSIEYKNGTLCLKNDECTFLRWSELPKEKLTVGDSGQKENVGFTLKGIEFTTEIPDCMLNRWGNTYEIEGFVLPDGMTYAKISIDVLNMSKLEINIPDTNLDLDVILNYNNGFIYATHDNQNSYFTTDTDYVIHEGIGGQRGTDIQIQPLQTKSLDIYIPCPELIANDENSPLSVGIISHYDTEIYYCEYSIR